MKEIENKPLVGIVFCKKSDEFNKVCGAFSKIVAPFNVYLTPLVSNLNSSPTKTKVETFVHYVKKVIVATSIIPLYIESEDVGEECILYKITADSVEMTSYGNASFVRDVLKSNVLIFNAEDPALLVKNQFNVHLVQLSLDSYYRTGQKLLYFSEGKWVIDTYTFNRVEGGTVVVNLVNDNSSTEVFVPFIEFIQRFRLQTE